MTAIVDSHCHLDFDALANRLPEVIANAEAQGVRLMVSISTRIRKLNTLLKIAEAHEQVYCTVGTHPHNAHEELDISVNEIVELAKHPKVIGIGEAGLDYHYDFSPRAAQAQGFRAHIAAARETGLPLVIHSREAEADTAAILEEEMAKGAFKPLLHCFSSGQELADRTLPLGAYCSFSGILTYKSAEEIRATARAVPLDRLLVETDAPYLAPVPWRGKTNEPAYVVKTLEALAAVHGRTRDEMARITSDNFFRLFSKAKRPAAFAEAA